MRALPQLKLEVGPEAAPKRDPSDLTAEEAFHQVFWPAYPRKIARHDALKAWNSLKIKDDDQATLDHIMRGLAHYIANEWEPDRPRFITYPATWLRGRRWEDVE